MVSESNVTDERRVTVTRLPKMTPVNGLVASPPREIEIVVDPNRNVEPVRTLMAALKIIPETVAPAVTDVPPITVTVDPVIPKEEKPSTVTVERKSTPRVKVVPDEDT